jgi:coniferyl-aldehyde dehydrogenase
VINLAPDQQLDAGRHKLAPHIVLGVNDEMTIMKEEIFGPILPIKPYRDTAEVIAYVNAHDRPLAFYPFTNDRRLAQRYITEILSGSVGINESIVQVGQHDCRSAASARAAWATTTATKALSPSPRCARCSTRPRSAR